MEAEITRYVLKNVLPKVLVKYITPDFYPVIVGGQVLDKCSGKNFQEATDIDIKFIATNKKVNEYEVVVARDECLSEILDLYHANKPENFPNLIKGKLRVQYAYRVTVFIEGDKHAVIIDTAVIGPEKEFMLQYKYMDHIKWLKSKNTNVLIPFEMHDSLPWADCTWVYIDTVRMLMIWSRDYEKTTLKSQKKYIVAKIIKYIGKLAHLEVYYRNHTSLKGVLEKSKKLLKESGANISGLMAVINEKTDYKKITSILKKAEAVKEDVEYFTSGIRMIKPSTPVEIRNWLSHNERFISGKYTLSFGKNKVIINNIFTISK